MPKPPRPAPPVIDETRVDPFPLRPARGLGLGPDGAGRVHGGAGPLVANRLPGHGPGSLRRGWGGI